MTGVDNTEQKNINEHFKIPKYDVIESHTDVLPNGFQYYMKAKEDQAVIEIREIRANVFDITVDFGFLTRNGEIVMHMVEVEKTRSINNDSSVGKEIFDFHLTGKRGLISQQGFVNVDIVPINSGEDAIKFATDEVESLLKHKTKGQHVKSSKFIDLMKIVERE